MYVFILVVFLQMQPIANVLFVAQFDSKKDCMAQVAAIQDKIPEDKADDVLCIQVVNQNKIQEI